MKKVEINTEKKQGGNGEMKMDKIKIKTKEQLRGHKNVLAKKNSVNMMKLIYSKDGIGFKLTKTMSNGMELNKTKAFVLNGKTEVVVDITDVIISVQFLANGSDDQKKTVLSMANLFRTVAIKLDGRKSDVISIAKSPKGLVGYSFMTNERFLVNLKDLRKQGYSLYVAGAYNPSESRKTTTTLYRCDNNKEIADLINKLSYGAFNIMVDRAITLEESQKFAARISQWKTGMTHMEESSMTVAYFCDKWRIDNTEHADGKAFVRDVKVASILSNDKYEVTRNATEGLLIQCRPFSVCKTETKTTNGNYIKEKILFDAGKDNIIWINREEVTPEQQSEFNNLFVQGIESKFKGKVIIIKPKDTPEDLSNVDYYTDLNGIKASYDLRLDSGLNILNIDKPLKGGVVNTNMQQLESFVAINPEATKDILKEIANSYNKKLYYGALTPTVKVPTIKEVEQLYTVGIIKSIAPGFALQNQKIFGAIADQAVQGMVKSARRLNYEVPGQNRILQFDFGADFGVRILPAGTCYAPGIKERVLIGTRNPKMFTGEFLLLKNLSRKEVETLINSNKELTKKQKKLLKREYKFLSESAVVISAHEEYKDAIGGADVDGDTLTITTYRKFSKLLKKAIKKGEINSTAIQVESKKVEQEKDMKFNLSAVHTAFVKLITNGNLSVGEVTLMNNYLLGLLFDVKAGKLDAAVEFFTWAGNDGNGDGEYTKLPRKYDGKLNMEIIKMSFDVAEDIVKKIKSMKLSEQNMIAALDDLNAAFMMLQMETIDAAKKGTTVPVPFKNMLNKFRQVSKTELDIDLGIIDKKKDYKGYKEIDGVRYLVETRQGWQDIKVGQQVNKVYFHQDLLNEIRLEAARDVMRAARKLRKVYNKVSFSDDIKHLFLTKLNSIDIRLARDLRELKNLYNSINAGIGEDEAQEPYYAVYLEALANTVRLITKDMSDTERALLVEAICMPSEDGRSRYSSFAMNTLKEEYIKMTVEHFAEIDVAGEKLTHAKNIKEGDILEFKFGVAKTEEKLAATKADIHGKFVIKEINGKLYTVKNIKDLLPEVKFTNKLVFRAVDEDIDTLKDTLMNAQNVELKVEFGKGNLIIVDGEVVGKFITSSGFGPLNRLYQDNKGTVERVMVVQERMNNGDMRDVLIAVLNCDSIPEVTNMKAAENKTIEVTIENLNATESNEEDLF